MKWKGRRQSKHIEIAPRDDVAAMMAYTRGHLTDLDPIAYENMRQEMGGEIPTPTPKPKVKKKKK